VASKVINEPRHSRYRVQKMSSANREPILQRSSCRADSYNSYNSIDASGEISVITQCVPRYLVLQRGLVRSRSRENRSVSSVSERRDL
jgi:hypothetical protein